jgi:hypothetical protein
LNGEIRFFLVDIAAWHCYILCTVVVREDALAGTKRFCRLPPGERWLWLGERHVLCAAAFAIGAPDLSAVKVV